ncbi:MAG: hypothetical protein ACE5E7_04080 [Anaerolineae bacterium]
MGFVSGINLAARTLHGQSDLVLIVVGLAAGLIGAGLALFLQQLAVGAAGFLAGGAIAANLVALLGLGALIPGWLAFIAGGIGGAILVALLFDWALIGLSAVTGAGFIAQSLHLQKPVMALVILALATIGIAFQTSQMVRESTGESAREPVEA